MLLLIIAVIWVQNLGCDYSYYDLGTIVREVFILIQFWLVKRWLIDVEILDVWLMLFVDPVFKFMKRGPWKEEKVVFFCR